MNENNGGFMWIFGLIVLLALFNGGGFGFGGNQAATNAEVQRGFDTQNLQSQTRDLMTASANNAAGAITAIKDGNAALIREFGTVETALTALSGKQQECCCEILRAIDGVNYNGAINTAAINANVTAQVQGIQDMLYQQKAEAQAARIQQLELNQAMAGVIRYPSAWMWNAGTFPPFTPPTTTTGT